MSKEKFYVVTKDIPSNSATYLKVKGKIELIVSDESILKEVSAEEVARALLDSGKSEESLKYHKF